MTVFRSRTDAALIEEPAKLCGSVAPSCDWVCAEPKGHAGRHGWKHGTTTASWPNLPELNATIVARDATIARLERERDNAVSDRKAAVAVGKTWADDYSRLKRETAELACVNCEDQRENEYARGYCPRHAEKKRDEIDRLERELAEAKRIVVSIRDRGRKAISALEDI